MSEPPNWFKSSYSDGEGGACVEATVSPAVVRVRDSKVLGGAELTVRAESWGAFIGYVTAGRPGA